MVELRSLRFVHCHRERTFMRRQTRQRDRAHRAQHLLREHCGGAVGEREHDADITVHQADVVGVLGDEDRTADPMTLAEIGAAPVRTVAATGIDGVADALRECLLQLLHAERTTAMYGEHAIAIEYGEQLALPLRVVDLRPITQRGDQRRGIALEIRGCKTRELLRRGLGDAVTAVGRSQALDAPVGLGLLARVARAAEHLDRQRVGGCRVVPRDVRMLRRVTLQTGSDECDVGRALKTARAREGLGVRSERRAMRRGGGRAGRLTTGRRHQIGEHAACLDARKLVAVAEQHEPRIRVHRLEQATHHREIDHRHFIDDDELRRDRVGGGVPDGAVGTHADEPVQRGGG